MKSSYWLLKSEPHVYSFSRLQKDKRTNWDHVRNFQARNYIRKMAKGDIAVIYHSGDERAAVGIAEVVKEAYPDIDPEGGDWSQVDIKPVQSFLRPVSLKEIKATDALLDLPLIKQSRLSVMPISENHFNELKKLGGLQ
jgi:predicted RNA-binding protein with PUA-like domain